MNTVACQGIQEYRQGSHEGLTLTRSHLGNLTLMEHSTTEELYVVVYHLPFQVVASGRPVVVVDGLVAVDGDEVLLRVGSQFAVEVGSRHHRLLILGKAASRLLHDAECHGHHLVQSLLILVQCLFVQFVNLVEDRFACVDGSFLNRSLLSLYLFQFRLGIVLYVLLYLLSLGTQVVVAECLYFGICSLNLLHERLYQFHVSCRLVTKE